VSKKKYDVVECHNCSETIRDNAKSCRYCGSSILDPNKCVGMDIHFLRNFYKRSKGKTDQELLERMERTFHSCGMFVLGTILEQKRAIFVLDSTGDAQSMYSLLEDLGSIIPF